LTRKDKLSSSIKNRAIDKVVISLKQSKHGPSSVNNHGHRLLLTLLLTISVLHQVLIVAVAVLLRHARLEGFTPTTILVLVLEQESATLLDGRAVSERETSATKTLHTEPGSISEADTPGTDPATIRALDLLDELDTVLDGALNELALRDIGLHLGKGLHARRRALNVRVIDHDTAKDLGWIEHLEPSRTASVLISSPATIIVLQRQHDMDSVLHTLDIDVAHTTTLGISFLGRLDQTGGVEDADSLETLCSAVRDRPTVIARGERPTALGNMAEVLLSVDDFISDLGVLNELISVFVEGTQGGDSVLLLESAFLTEFVVVGHNTLLELGEGLDSEGSVPALRAVIALELDTVLGKPHVIDDAGLVQAELHGVATVTVVSTEHVDELGDRTDIDIVRLLILRRDIIEDEVESLLTEERLERQLLVQVHETVGNLQQQGLLGVLISHRHEITVLGEINSVVLLDIELGTKSLDEGINRSAEASTIDISHGEIHHSAVAPEATGINGQELREQPHLRENRVHTLPRQDIQHGEPELTPRRNSEGTAVFPDPLEGVLGGRVLRRDAEETE